MERIPEKKNQKRRSLYISLSKSFRKNRYCLSSIVDEVQFLCLNELAFQGDGKLGINTLNEDDENESLVLCMRLFEYTLKKDEKLRTIYKSIPKNASFTSARFQNELIQILRSNYCKKNGE